MNDTAQGNDLSALNIFEVLGVTDVTDQEREALLGEFQDVIWQEIVESEHADALGDTDVEDIAGILDNDQLSVDQKRDELFAYLSRKIENLDVILEEKTNLLKLEMLNARIEGMLEYFSDQTDKHSQVEQAGSLAESGQYTQALEILNRLSAEIPDEN